MGIGVETLAPKAVAHDCHRVTLVRWRVQTAKRTADAEHIEEIRAGRHLPGNFVAPGRIPIRVAEAGAEGHVLKNPGILEVAVPGSADHIANPHQSVWPAGAHIVENHFASDA